MTFEESVVALETLWRTQGIVTGLDRIHFLLNALGHPEETFPKILITGTNGKGSVAAMTAAVLTQAGVRTGLYTSPHIDSYTERFQVNGLLISRERFVALFEIVQKHIEACREAAGPPTEFEILTAMAFLYFAEQKVDIAVCEIGLGGRFDATNVGDALVSVITSVAMDHMTYLGNTLEKIAYEKSGIARPNRPLIIGTIPLEARAVIEAEAVGIGARIVESVPRVYTYGRVIKLDNQWGQWVMLGESEKKALHIWTPFLGSHQAINTAIVERICHELSAVNFPVSQEAFQEGLMRLKFPGRFEIVGENPLTIRDGAHNPEAAEALALTLDEFSAPRPRTLVVSLLTTKDARGFISVLASAVDHIIVTSSPHPHAQPAYELASIVQSLTYPCDVVPSPGKALHKAREVTGPKGTVIVAGSFSLLAGISA